MQGEGESFRALQQVSVLTLSGHRIPMTDFFTCHRIVLVVFRRFGCVICREAAVEISKLKDSLDSMGIRLVGVGFDKDDYAVHDFLLYWGGELYIDEKRQVYEALRVKRFGITEMFGVLDPRGHVNVRRARAAGMKGYHIGADPFQLGGTFVIGPAPHGILYAHRQQFYGDLANNDEVMAACKTLNIVFGVYNQQP